MIKLKDFINENKPLKEVSDAPEDMVLGKTYQVTDNVSIEYWWNPGWRGKGKTEFILRFGQGHAARVHEFTIVGKYFSEEEVVTGVEKEWNTFIKNLERSFKAKSSEL